MEGSEARLVSCVDVGPKVNEAGDGGDGAGFILFEGLDSQMNRSHSISVPQILGCPSTKQEGYCFALEPYERGKLKERNFVMSSSFQAQSSL